MPTTEPRYRHILRAVYETPWAILPARLATILAIVHERVSGYTPTLDEIEARIAAGQEDHGLEVHAGSQTQRATGSVAVLPILGTLTQRGGMTATSEPLTSTARVGQAFRLLMADPSVSAIVLEIDSPGGTVDGVQELADEIFKARGSKPIVAVANSTAASAAYWIAAAADEIVVTPSGEVGSIGVFAAHQDLSAALEQEGVKISLISAGKFKTEGNPYQSLDAEARGAIQARVDDYYRAFTGAVARGRGVGVQAVRGGFGEGRMVGAQEAVRLGMADQVATLDDTIRRVASGKRLDTRRASELDVSRIEALAEATVTAALKMAALEAEVDEAVTAAVNSLDLRRRRLRHRALA